MSTSPKDDSSTLPSDIRKAVTKALYPHIDDGGAHTVNMTKVNAVCDLLASQVAAAREEQVMQDFLELHFDFDQLDEKDLIEWRERQIKKLKEPK